MIKVRFEKIGETPKVRFGRLMGDEVDFLFVDPTEVVLPNAGGSVVMNILTNDNWIIE